MSTLIKSLTAAGGVGAVSTGAYFAMPSKEDVSIRARLEKSGYSILNLDKKDTTQSGEWGKIKTAYGKESEALLRFSNVVKDTDYTVSGLKDACSSLLSSESKKDEDLEKARRWCVVPVTVSSRLGDKLSLMDTTTTTTNADDSLWDKKLKEHQDANSKLPKIPNVWGTEATDDAKKKNALKTKCGEMAKLSTFDKDFETFVSYTRDWCTKPKK
ncbi:hypothetical protein HF1_11400 [Mycoplasma haemofelis str. Langford 1]|uniref:Uncharacterized protein n=1 Tax=Mycoplasma haemofelis (strain Langford 1) TaxID=941640 RepID=E8ZJ27_MYCHL|nr:hypothetical protein [Mycoplasma haemofelis]CBY93148.1 hypothetical protein HF1_11400 [Mycoplasma haemofelis str. Langford 1]